MDFHSRDRYRHAVEDLAEPTGEAQLRVALRTVESARQAAQEQPTGRAAHVGYHLIGKGRVDLETDVAYHLRFTRRIRRSIFRHATALYLGSIAIVTALLLSFAASYLVFSGASGSRMGIALLLLFFPSSDLALAFVQRLAAGLAPPRRLPRMDFTGQIPEHARTMVIVPTMLTTAGGVDLLLEHVEVLALGNSDPFIHFAILSDFADTSTSNAPSDDAILARARAGIEAREIGQVIGGCVSQVGEQSYNVARTAWLSAGLPLEVAATTVDSQCGSSQQASTLAAGLVGSGLEDVVLSCGVEMMSRVPLGANFSDKKLGRPVPKSYFAKYAFNSQFQGAELIAKEYGITRDDTDRFGLRSQENAARAWREGRPDDYAAGTAGPSSQQRILEAGHAWRPVGRPDA